jgi:hypothetical protein
MGSFMLFNNRKDTAILLFLSRLRGLVLNFMLVREGQAVLACGIERVSTKPIRLIEATVAVRAASTHPGQW